MSAKFRFDGLAALKAELDALPTNLTGEADKIVEGNANGAVLDLKRGYGDHIFTGKLLKMVTSAKVATGPFGVAVKVRSNSPLAWLFDNGSQARHKRSGASTGRMWGKTPPTHLFVRTLIKARQELTTKLSDLLIRNGISVRND